MAPLDVVVLAAGLGKRMRSRLPKVLHPVLHRPMLHQVLDTVRALEPRSVTVVVGHGAELVEASCQGIAGLQFARQKEQKGTGDAVRSAVGGLAAGGRLLVLCGDTPLLRTETLRNLVAGHAQSGAAATLLFAELADAAAYGRVLRTPDGKVRAIREAADCTAEEKAVRAVNSGVYVFETAPFLPALQRLSPRNAQGEFYLTDTVELLLAEGKSVGAVALLDADEMSGINDRAGLVAAESILRRRLVTHWLAEGATILDPETVRIDARTQLAPDVTVEPHCVLIDSRVGEGSYLEAGTRLVRTVLGKNVVVKQGSYLEQAQVGDRTQLGPYAHLRPGSVLAEDVKIGNFVELKKTTFGPRSKASHLSYLGDATVGADVNVGCGFVTCNFDGGPVKHRTVIEDGAFIGSDSQAVAPVTIGRGAYVGSGSTITKDVPADALAVSRTRQENKEGYGARLRKRQQKASKSE